MPGATPCLSASSAVVVFPVLSCPTTDLQDRDSLMCCPGAAEGAFVACTAAQGSTGVLETALQKRAYAHKKCNQQSPFGKSTCLPELCHAPLNPAPWSGFCYMKMVFSELLIVMWL
jgi:hypothetical protein